jgi:hypothetical protein
MSAAVNLPWGAAQFAGTMVSFVLLRKAGKAHLLVPHQASIGAAVGLTIGSSLAAAAGVWPGGSPGSPTHVPAVLLPQQALFCAALLLRHEVGLPELALLVVALLATVAGLHLHATGAGNSVVILSVLSACMMGTTVLPSLRSRVKILLGLWSFVAFAPVFWHTTLPPAALLLVVEHLALLTVKLQLVEPDAAEAKRK